LTYFTRRSSTSPMKTRPEAWRRPVTDRCASVACAASGIWSAF